MRKVNWLLVNWHWVEKRHLQRAHRSELFIFSTDDQNALQDDINRIYQWSLTWQLPISIIKTKYFQIGNSRLAYSYFLNGEQISNVDNTIRDLGVLISQNLTFSPHCCMIAAKANQMLGFLFKVLPPDQKLLVTAYKVYVRPILEYATTVWSPHLSKDILLLENVQLYFTRRVLGYLNLNYPERLILLGLEFLEMRRLQADLILCYKILTENVSVNCQEFLFFLRVLTCVLVIGILTPKN